MRMSEDLHKCICLEASTSFLQCGHLRFTETQNEAARAQTAGAIVNSPPLVGARKLLLFHVSLKQRFKSSRRRDLIRAIVGFVFWDQRLQLGRRCTDGEAPIKREHKRLVDLSGNSEASAHAPQKTQYARKHSVSPREGPRGTIS